MTVKAVYKVIYNFDGVRYEKYCTGYDFDVSVIGCLTLYFSNSNGRIVLPAYKIEDFKAECVWSIR